MFGYADHHDEMKTRSGGSRPLVSVVIPTYDRPGMLVEAVESVAAQRYPDIELIVVDDGSPTAAATVLEDQAPSDLAWRSIRHEDNRGANAARNSGIRDARGDVIAFLDDDDRWLPETVAAQVAALDEAEAGAVLVGQRMRSERGEETIRLPSVDGNATAALITGEPAGTFSTLAVRRAVVDRAGLPDERFPALQDREWMVRLSQHCEFASIREPLVERRFGDYDQINDDYQSKRDTTVPLFVEKHASLAADYGRERQFKAWLATSVAGSGLVNGYYDDARRFAARAIRTDPRQQLAYVYLLLAMGGHLTYRPAVRLARICRKLKGRLPTRRGLTG